MVYEYHYCVSGHYPSSAFYLKQRFGDWILFRLQVEPTQFDLIERASPYLRRLSTGLALSIGPNWVGSTWRRKQNPVSETLSFSDKNRTIGNVQKHNNCIRLKWFFFSVRIYESVIEFWAQRRELIAEEACLSKLKKLNSVAVVRKRTLPTEQPPLVGKVSANLCW
jgi:hypothetical protein